MNITPTAEEIKDAKFKIVKPNTELPSNATRRAWKKDDILTIAECNNITQRDQFGLSLKVQIDGHYYFLKLPPGPEELQLPVGAEEAKKDHNAKIIKQHYQTMRARFNDEFEKCPFFQHIITRCEGATFSIARPLAYCVVLKTLGGVEVELPGLIYDFIPGDDLSKTKDWLVNNETAEKFLEFAKGLTRVVQLIHNQGVLHSFLVPRNIIKMANENRYTLVGFGYSSFCDARHHAPLGTVSGTDSFYRAPECGHKDNLGALWFPVDIYSIGAILYQLATNSKPNNVEGLLPRDVNRLKEHIYNKLSHVNALTGKPSPIFTDNENILKILNRCLRSKPQDRFSCAEELIEALTIAEQATGVRAGAAGPDTPSAPSHSSRIHEILVEIASKSPSPDSIEANTTKPTVASPRVCDNLNHLFDSLLKGWSDKAVEDAERMQRGHYEIYGHRDALVNSLCRLLAGARNGDIYRTMTLPSYWTDNNLGSNGRFLTMNKHMARKGVNIERVFLVSKRFHELTEREQEILEFQYEAAKNVNESFPGKFNVMVKVLKNEQELTDFETNGTLVAYLESGQNINREKWRSGNGRKSQTV